MLADADPAPARRSAGASPPSTRSALFRYLNQGKTSAVADPAGERLRDLAGLVDIVIRDEHTALAAGTRPRASPPARPLARAVTDWLQRVLGGTAELAGLVRLSAAKNAPIAGPAKLGDSHSDVADRKGCAHAATSTPVPAGGTPAPATNTDKENAMFLLLKDVPVINHPLLRIALGVAPVVIGLLVLHLYFVAAIGGLLLIMALVSGTRALTGRTEKGQLR